MLGDDAYGDVTKIYIWLTIGKLWQNKSKSANVSDGRERIL